MKLCYYLTWILFLFSFNIIFGESITVQIAQSSDDAEQDVMTSIASFTDDDGDSMWDVGEDFVSGGESTVWYCEYDALPWMGYHSSYGNMIAV